ncbi:(S)-scoulerine 9-O-methyltransferase-like [Cornus florida]|uniref:(S)-scoulerine 9-O-methyltransferase-like n=1 Tax=Cornus florida TaxID=4283 RepID=UPI0028A05170|nr:(S)-scoulerine 9-O-methyltransferase-like [Cornus florida]XP_059636544.1 (S)-scoulerine 9-O-methyltransferase-like [Cornus florida]
MYHCSYNNCFWFRIHKSVLSHILTNRFVCVEHIAGDMFKSLPNAQAILLKTILHNWDDDRCIMLLRNCWKAVPDDGNGKVIVVEFAIPQLLQNDAEAVNTIAVDFYMMVVTNGGKERTTTEFADLAKPEAVNAIAMDFNMMIVTNGGKERATTEFADLAKAKLLKQRSFQFHQKFAFYNSSREMVYRGCLM